MQLLNQVAAIKMKYDSITKITGENYNLFRLLGMASNEVKTHTAILADLLNPCGSHERGDVFLQLFLDECKVTGFNTSSAQALSEYYIGPLTTTTGGRIDIM